MESIGNDFQQFARTIEENKEPHVGDVFQLVTLKGQVRAWKVTGVFLGALHQENTVSLKVLDRADPHNEIHVPKDIFVQILNFNRV